MSYPTAAFCPVSCHPPVVLAVASEYPFKLVFRALRMLPGGRPQEHARLASLQLQEQREFPDRQVLARQPGRQNPSQARGKYTESVLYRPEGCDGGDAASDGDPPFSPAVRRAAPRA